MSETSAEVQVESREPTGSGAQSIRLFVRHRPIFLATVHADARTAIYWGMHGASRRDARLLPECGSVAMAP